MCQNERVTVTLKLVIFCYSFSKFLVKQLVFYREGTIKVPIVVLPSLPFNCINANTLIGVAICLSGHPYMGYAATSP